MISINFFLFLFSFFWLNKSILFINACLTIAFIVFTSASLQPVFVIILPKYLNRHLWLYQLLFFTYVLVSTCLFLNFISLHVVRIRFHNFTVIFYPLLFFFAAFFWWFYYKPFFIFPATFLRFHCFQFPFFVFYTRTV